MILKELSEGGVILVKEYGGIFNSQIVCKVLKLLNIEVQLACKIVYTVDGLGDDCVCENGYDSDSR